MEARNEGEKETGHWEAKVEASRALAKRPKTFFFLMLAWPFSPLSAKTTRPKCFLLILDWHGASKGPILQVQTKIPHI